MINMILVVIVMYEHILNMTVVVIVTHTLILSMSLPKSSRSKIIFNRLMRRAQKTMR